MWPATVSGTGVLVAGGATECCLVVPSLTSWRGQSAQSAPHMDQTHEEEEAMIHFMLYIVEHLISRSALSVSQ